MPDRTDAPDGESTDFPHASGLPDDPNLEMELAGHGGRFDPGLDWLDVMCVGCHAVILVSPGGEAVCPRWLQDSGDEPDAPCAALFPEVVTWTDEQLVVAIELADLREPGLNLHAVEDLPDRHEAFLHAGSAELVRRLEERGLRFAARRGRPRRGTRPTHSAGRLAG